MQLNIKCEPGCEPRRAHPDDAGLDLVAKHDTVIPPQTKTTIGTGCAVAIPHNHVGLVAIRSSIGFNHNTTLANSVGIIDTGYTGEIKCALVNHNTDTSITINKGDRIAQLLIIPITLPQTNLVDHLEPTTRGTNGIGSTGRN